MHSNNIYIIGWKGFIGQRYIDYLESIMFDGEIYLYLREAEFENIRIFKNIKINFINYSGMIKKLLVSQGTIIYLANKYSPTESIRFSVESVQDNLIPFIKLLEDIKENARNIKFIFTSSGGTIYGDTRGENCKETHPLVPKSIYAANKVAQENFLSVYGLNHGLDYNILRIANPYGPGQRLRGGQGLIPAVLQSVMNNTTLPIFGDGNATRDYLYIDDLCIFIHKVIQYKGIIRVFNVGSGEAHSILDIINCFNSVINRKVKYEFTNTEFSAVNKIVLDISLAKKELDWQPLTPLKDGIKAFISWSEKKTL